MKELIGKTVNKLTINDGETILAFCTSEGVIAYETWGDCCSDTWFSDITGVDALLGAVVVNTEELNVDGYNTEDGRCRQDYDKVYGHKLITNKGWVDIVFRNSSNGYYGGSIELLTRKLKDDMKEITEDWTA